MKHFSFNPIYYSFIFIIAFSGCKKNIPKTSEFEINQAGLTLELILHEPEIMTPIGLTIDEKDDLYVLESHTHTPMQDYQGPAFDRIKKGIDTDGDLQIDQWIIFADSIEDGMNLNYHQNYGVFLATKNQILQLKDSNHDGVADQRTEILKMYPPENVYDHAGILGVVVENDGWIYVSRGNCGSSFWQIKSMAGEIIEGYGDGGNVFRCRVNGTGLEEVATGFWNPFGLAFSAEGRLLLTDNDPDSRGPNRLIEVVPGGNYGYQSLYGGSGIHPYLAWNGELPGTLPYAAPLGEAPCGLIDASFTNLDKSFKNHILASVWEENNIVMIPLEKRGSSIYGKPKVLIQGGKDFHPVAFAANSRGEVYFTDWVIRQYPNHGHGKIWKLSSGKSQPLIAQNQTEKRAIDRFAAINLSDEEITQKLENGDPFERTIIRNHLVKSSNQELALSFLQSENPRLCLEGILVMMELKFQLDQPVLQTLLKDQSEEIRRMTLIYIGEHARDDMRASLEEILKTGYISPDLFETYLATIRHIDPGFINGFQTKAALLANKLHRNLPEGYIQSLITNPGIEEKIRAIALPYLEKPETHHEILVDQLKQAKDESYQMALLKSLKNTINEPVAESLLSFCLNKSLSEKIRAQAISMLVFQAQNYCSEIKELIQEKDPQIQYAVAKYACRCDETVKTEIDTWISQHADFHPTAKSVWQNCLGAITDKPASKTDWANAVNNQGNPATGRLVFESLNAQCQTCHQVNSWGGTFGPGLSNIGSSKSKELLINAILNPSQEMAPEWQGWFVVDKEGNTHYGRQIDVHLNKVELMNTDGSFATYGQAQSFGVSETSLMPEGLEQTMTKEEFNDLIAYLTSLQ